MQDISGGGGGISYDADGGKKTGRDEREKVEDASGRRLDRISRNSRDLFPYITAFAAGAASPAKYQNRSIIGLNIDAVPQTHTRTHREVLTQHDSNM